MKALFGFALMVTLSSYQLTNQKIPTPATGSIFRVAIDPGHIGNDEGMMFNGAVAKEITSAIASELLKSDLQRTSIVLLNGLDSDNELKRRLKQSRHYDLYISLHVGFNEALKSGPEVFYSVKSDHIASSQGYGDFFAGHLSDQTTSAREAESPLLVLDHLNCPAIQVQTGNLGTLADFSMLTSQEGQKQIAQKLANAINKLAVLKSQNELGIASRSLKPQIDSLFFKSVKQAADKH